VRLEAFRNIDQSNQAIVEAKKRRKRKMPNIYERELGEPGWERVDRDKATLSSLSNPVLKQTITMGWL
jgi:hypothetical protein